MLQLIQLLIELGNGGILVHDRRKRCLLDLVEVRIKGSIFPPQLLHLLEQFLSLLGLLVLQRQEPHYLILLLPQLRIQLLQRLLLVFILQDGLVLLLVLLRTGGLEFKFSFRLDGRESTSSSNFLWSCSSASCSSCNFLSCSVSLSFSSFRACMGPRVPSRSCCII